MRKIKTKIVCTIGPSTWSPEVLKVLIDSGMRVARINASFADAAEIARVTDLIRSVSKDVAVLLDLKGHKIRISDIGEPRELKMGEEILLSTDQSNTTDIVVSYENLHKDIQVGGLIFIDDGKVRLEVTRIEGTNIYCTVKNNSVLKRLKTVNVPGTYLTFDPLTEKDKVDIEAGVASKVDLIAGSFVRDRADIEAIQERIQGTDIKIIAKIEDPLGVKNFDEILESVHGIMVARGDLGVEIPFEQVPILQKEFIRKCNKSGKPVIVATHMLESMTTSPAATRAEVSDIANAVEDGTDAIMLSAESSTGAYPVEAVTTMATISEAMEPLSEFKSYEDDFDYVFEMNPDNNDDSGKSAVTIAKATAESCKNMDVKAVLVLTKQGFTARMLSRQKIKQPIYAFTSSSHMARILNMSRGVHATSIEGEVQDRDELITKIVESAKYEGYIKEGDLIAIVIGSSVFKGKDSSVLEITKI